MSNSLQRQADRRAMLQTRKEGRKQRLWGGSQSERDAHAKKARRGHFKPKKVTPFRERGRS